MTAVRRRQILLASGALLAAPLAARAQQPRARVARVGFLVSETVADSTVRIESVRAGLRERGYVEGRNLAIEIRAADGDYVRLPDLAASLVRGNVDVLVAFGSKAVVAARQATTTVPIVDPVMGDPVGSGLAKSLARPGGNVTGLSGFGADLPTKRVELLKEAVQRIARLALIVNPANAPSASTRAAIGRMVPELKTFEAREAADLGALFAAMAKARVDSLLVSTDTLFQAHAGDVAALAARYRLPSVGSGGFAEAGGLLGYGVNDADLFRRGGDFVARILNGAKPAEMPIEQPTRFQLVVNLKTSRALGIAIPNSVLIRADRRIE